MFVGTNVVLPFLFLTLCGFWFLLTFRCTFPTVSAQYKELVLWASIVALWTDIGGDETEAQNTPEVSMLSTPTDTEAISFLPGAERKNRVLFVEEPMQENGDKCLKRGRQHGKLWFMSLFPMCGLWETTDSLVQLMNIIKIL